PMPVPLKRAELVIEATVEKLDLKKKVFAELDELAGEQTILATNTSALPVSELAAATRRPGRVLGLHFFNPVHRMQLVEIVAARQTSPEVLQRALRFVQQIGKLPVIVQDSPGFLVNRILMPYLVEAGNLFAAGASVTELDEAMLDFGMPIKLHAPRSTLHTPTPHDPPDDRRSRPLPRRANRHRTGGRGFRNDHGHRLRPLPRRSPAPRRHHRRGQSRQRNGPPRGNRR